MALCKPCYGRLVDPLNVGIVVTVASTGVEGADVGGPTRLGPCGRLDLRTAAELKGLLEARGHRVVVLDADSDLDRRLQAEEIQCAFLCLHGRRGGSGMVQSLLRLRGIPFAGPPAGAVTLAYDKLRARQLLAYHNLPTPTTVALTPGSAIDPAEVEMLGWPCVLKPRRGSLGAGLTLLAGLGQVPEAIERALEVDEELLLERAVGGPELQCVLFDGVVVGIMQIQSRRPPGQAQVESCEMVCPPRLPRARLEGIRRISRRACEVLGLHRGPARVDLLLSPRHNELILEVEALPPLHKGGVVARVAAAAGVGRDGLVIEMMRQLEQEVRANQLRSTRGSANNLRHAPEPRSTTATFRHTEAVTQ